MADGDFLAATRAAYDAVAGTSADALRLRLDRQPLDRAMLAAFAELVDGPVADLGCGPGLVTARLHALGVDVSGVDLSPGMVALARRTHPGLRFAVGSMLALELADGALGGAVAWYSTIHVPPDRWPGLAAELARVLRPGGLLLLAFPVGDGARPMGRAYGQPVDVDAHRLPPDRVAADLAAAGLVETARLVRAPDPTEPVPQAYVLAERRGG